MALQQEVPWWLSQPGRPASTGNRESSSHIMRNECTCLKSTAIVQLLPQKECWKKLGGLKTRIRCLVIFCHNQDPILPLHFFHLPPQNLSFQVEKCHLPTLWVLGSPLNSNTQSPTNELQSEELKLYHKSISVCQTASKLLSLMGKPQLFGICRHSAPKHGVWTGTGRQSLVGC